MGVKSLSLLLVVFVVAVYGAAQDQSTKIFPGVLRDQAPDTMCTGTCKKGGSCGSANGGKGFYNTDFEIVLGTYQNGEKGIVGAQCDAGNNWQNCGKIGDDRTPIYAYSNPPRGSPGNNTRSPDSFYTWFHHTNQTKAINYNITLSQSTGNTYQYVNNSFFPIDGMGWNDYCSGHNYGYCFEGHSRFGYQGGEVFAFTGDDDVWVYINNMLVIDLGALHQELSMSVNLDDIQPPLVKGSNYLIDFFYCERHTTESQIRLTTSIGLYCAYTDWCGVCEGTGLSCCTAEHAKLCDDGDPCTIDKCGVRVAPPEGCEHTQIVCTPKDKCHNAICANGTCAQVPITCNDGKACTNDTCSPTLGCQYTSYVCNDNSLCTDDACVEPTGQCQFTPISCTGTNACRNYTCSPTRGCQSTTITCNPNNKCTTPYTCTDTVNGCPTAPITCTPPTPCHNAVCDPAVGCNFSNKTCSDGLVCTTDSCNPTTGACVYTDVSCDDGNPCTKDSCSESAGGCVYLKSACTPALCQDAVCVDFEGCRYTPKSCSDGLKCTQDICNSNGTCVNPPVVCTPADKCHTSVCNPSTGSCDVNVVNCDDSDPCTSDVCDPLSGCVHTKVTCNDNLTCTTDACDPSSGCVYTPITCAPDSTLCNCVGGVCEENTACDDHDGCTVDSCDSNSGCSYAPKNCDDDNICTVDSCLSPSGNCSNVNDLNTICGAPPNQCFSWNCAKDTGCYLSAKVCNDGNPCTTDLCVNATGECQHTYIGLNCENCGGNPCTYTDFCNPSICNNATSQCEIKPVDCDDGSVCTNDFCNPLNGSCYFTTIPCADNTDLCNPKSCKPLTGCVVEPVPCNSNNPCNIDTCSDGTCNSTGIECPVANKCLETANCNPNTGKCETTPLVKECDDDNNCTVDSCDPATGDCIYTPLSCSTDICSPEMCNQDNGKCESTIPPCDDRNACTVDENVCIPGVGVQCQHYANTSLCDDGDACTRDECSGNSTAICTHVPTVCASVDACHVSLGCDPESGKCVNVSKNCENQTVDWCSPFSCDSMAGCIEIPRTCPNKDIGCYVAVCRSNGSMNGTCELDRVSNWGSAKGKNGVLCPLLYDDAAKAAAIAGGAVAGIVIGAVAAAGLIGFGGKKGYDYLMAKNSPIGDVGNNPLYAPSGGSGENPLFKS